MADPAAPFLSVITPSFQCAGKIDATIRSVLDQPDVALEYIVVDGGSTDGTVDRLRRYGPALRWVSEPDKGIYDAMNKGLRLARGRFLYFLGCGDRLRPGALREVAAAVGRLPDQPDRPLLVYGNVYWESLDLVYGGPFDAVRLRDCNICHQAAFYERTIYDRHGEFDLRYAIHADYVLNLRCFGDLKVRKVYLDLIVADFEGTGVSVNRDGDPFYRDQLRLAREHLGLYQGFRSWFDPRAKWHLNRLKDRLLRRKDRG